MSIDTRRSLTRVGPFGDNQWYSMWYSIRCQLQPLQGAAFGDLGTAVQHLVCLYAIGKFFLTKNNFSIAA